MKEQENIVVSNGEKIADLQAIQLFSGIDSQGEQIQLKDNGPWAYGYRPYTMVRKAQKGQPYDRVTWRDTGALYRSLYTAFSSGQFRVMSRSEQGKYDEMIDRSGDEVIGLTESSRLEFAEDVLLPAFKEVLLKKTGLKL